jgi:hypothetical protein
MNAGHVGCSPDDARQLTGARIKIRNRTVDRTRNVKSLICTLLIFAAVTEARKSGRFYGYNHR